MSSKCPRNSPFLTCSTFLTVLLIILHTNIKYLYSHFKKYVIEIRTCVIKMTGFISCKMKYSENANCKVDFTNYPKDINDCCITF